MKSITFLPLYHSTFKYLGLGICLVGLGLIFLVNPHYQLLSYAGLIMMVFSKEKVESELIRSIRAEVFKSVFGLTISLVLALYITEVLSKSFTFQVTPFISIGMPLLLYLLVFYFTLILKINVDSGQDFATNFKNHRRFYGVWFLILIAVTGVFIVRLLVL